MKSYESNEWMKQGVCRDMPPDLFFDYVKEKREIAMTACGMCAVRETCLSYALENRIDHGIWGGTDEEKRRHIRRAQQKVAEAKGVA